MDNWNKIEFIFCFRLHVSPIHLERLEFYRIQFIIKEYEVYLERENKEYEKQQREAEKQSSGSTPNFGGFKVPKFDIPTFNIPKM